MLAKVVSSAERLVLLTGGACRGCLVSRKAYSAHGGTGTQEYRGYREYREYREYQEHGSTGVQEHWGSRSEAGEDGGIGDSGNIRKFVSF